MAPDLVVIPRELCCVSPKHKAVQVAVSPNKLGSVALGDRLDGSGHRKIDLYQGNQRL